MKPSDRRQYQGKTFDLLTLQVIHTADTLLALPKYGAEVEPATWTQGSFRPWTNYSGPTHRRCGAGDATAWNWRNRVIVFDLLGMVGFHRTPKQGPWPEHVHLVLNGFSCVDPYAQDQIKSAMNGRDGLKGNRKDPDRNLRSRLWPTPVFEGRIGLLSPNTVTHLYDGPSSTRKKLRVASTSTAVVAIMEVVNQSGHTWFVTDKGEWGYSPKWVTR